MTDLIILTAFVYGFIFVNLLLVWLILKLFGGGE